MALVMLRALLLGALVSFPKDGVKATRAVLRALTQDPFAGASKVGACKATRSNSRMMVRRIYYNSSFPLGSNFAYVNIKHEPKLFYLEMTSEKFNNNSSNWFRLRVGQGGQIYSLTGAYGEAMPPNMNTNQPFVNDVLQSVVYHKNNFRKINQAGASIYYPQNSDLRGIPFWSPNAGADPFGENISTPGGAIDCADNSCRVISWGQPNALNSRQGSSALFYSQYSNCGAGVIEITTLVHNMADSPSIKSISKHNATVFGEMSIPEIHVRNSTFEEIFISDATSLSASRLKTRPKFVSSNSIIRTLSKTDGYTIFSRGFEGEAEQTRVKIPCATSGGIKVKCSDSMSVGQVNLTFHPSRKCIITEPLSTDLGETVIKCFLADQPLAVVANFGFSSRRDPVVLRSSRRRVELVTRGIYFWAKNGNMLMFFNRTEETLDDINRKLGYYSDSTDGILENINLKFDSAFTPTADTFADSPAIAVVHGTLSNNKSWGSSYLRLGQDLPLKNDALKMVCIRVI